MIEKTLKRTIPRTGVRALLGALSLSLALAPAALAADCLEYVFFVRRGGFFPNPYNPTTQAPIKADITLYVFDEDLNLHMARLRRKTINVYGATVDGPEPLGTYESRRSQIVPNVWNGRNNNNIPVASSVYFHTIHVDSTVCGRKTVHLDTTLIK